MCGRFTLRTPLNRLVEQLMLDFAPVEISPRYNIAPTQSVPVARLSDGGQRQLDLMRWGLIPSWAKDASIGNRMINARAETVADKPAFRAAFKRRRCLVPADGYYEWQKRPDGKQPYLIALRDESPFAFAGLWETWKDESNSSIDSFTIITTDANETTQPIHDRMPVILSADDYSMWLDPTFQNGEALKELLRPYDSQAMVVRPVSRHVNSPRNDDPKCVESQQEPF